MKYTFTLPGNPIPLARARIKSSLIFDLSRKKMWDPQKQLKLSTFIALQNQFEEQGLIVGRIPFKSAIHFDATFFMAIPASSSTKIKTFLNGKFHIKRPDLSNMLKFIEDACLGLLYKDDSIISSITIKKIYDKNPRTVFTIREIKE